MLNFMLELANCLEVDLYWVFLILGLLLILGVVKCIYPWQPKWKSKTIKDENGEETIYYQIKE